jgi:branched-chain amino acid transport system substrate-binding protein
MSQLGSAAVYRFDFQSGSDPRPLSLKLLETQASVVAVVAAPDDSSRLVCCLREAAYTGAVFGGPAMAHRRFLQQAGAAAEGVCFPDLYHPMDDRAAFAVDFVRRFGHAPDYTAAHTYDALQLVIAAIRKGGLNRARIRDALVELAPWNGVSGTIHWDGLGSNTRPVGLGTIRDGKTKWQP